MALSFQKALYIAGGLLILIGIAMGFMAAGMLEQASDISSALAAGVAASYFALFSGVLIGVGTALAVTGLLVNAKIRKARTGAAAIFCFALLLSIMLFMLGKPSSFSFALLVASIASAVFAISMLFATAYVYFIRKE
ncbi:MAG: hypothetical protein NTV88_04380 [Candidatus Micrarchaeota archaeon]|nr:hypothetical protein [Candidatus Micrarchaeota archaeon]